MGVVLFYSVEGSFVAVETIKFCFCRFPNSRSVAEIFSNVELKVSGIIWTVYFESGVGPSLAKNKISHSFVLMKCGAPI